MGQTASQVHVHSFTDKSTVAYLVFMWETMVSLANRPGLLRLTAHCTGPKAVSAIQDANLHHARALHVPRPGWMGKNDAMAGSECHAAGVEHAMSMCDDGDIHVIVDSDTVILAKGWDDLVRLRHEAGVGIFGATYEDIGGFSSGRDGNQTYKKIPNAVWMSLSPAHSWKALEARPRKQECLPINSEERSKIYNLPVGNSVLRDVGWQLPQYLHDHNISYEGMRQLKPTKDAQVLKGLSDYHEEFHVDGRPYLVHHRGSSKHAYRGDRISKQFYEAVDLWLRQELEGDPRWLWHESPAETFIKEVSPIEDDGVPAIETIEDVQAQPSGDWLKVTVNGSVTRPRSDGRPGAVVDVRCPTNGTQHVRLEGPCKGITVEVPTVTTAPYLVVVRNMTLGAIYVKTPAGISAKVAGGSNRMVVVDVDGVSPVS